MLESIDSVWSVGREIEQKILLPSRRATVISYCRTISLKKRTFGRAGIAQKEENQSTMEHSRTLSRPSYDVELEYLSHPAQPTSQSSEAPLDPLTASRPYVATLDAQAFQQISSDPSITYTKRTTLAPDNNTTA